MKKIISLILSVTMLASAAQLYASADIAPEVVQSETVQEANTQSTAQETTQTSDSESDTATAESTSAESAKIKTAASTLLKSENADEEQSGNLTTVNSPMLTSITDLGGHINLGDDFYANISYKNFNLTIGEDLGSGNYNVLIKEKDGSTKQIWRFQRRTDGSYKITNVNSNSCLDVKESGDTDGKNVGVWKDNDSLAQKWHIYQKSNESYVLSPECTTTRVLNVNQGLAESGTNVDIWTYADEDRCAFSINNISMSLDGDIDTVTNDSIKFQLFDYDQDINYSNDVKTTTDTYKYDPGQPTKYTRELTKYFAFHGIDNANHHTYRPLSSGDTEACPYIGTVEAYDERVFLPNHATVERTLDNGYPVVNVTRNAYGVENAKTHSFLKPTDISYDERKIDYLFGGTDDASVTKYTPNNSLLYKTADGHYHYNSAEHAVDYDVNNDMFKVREYTEIGGAAATYDVDLYKDIDGNAFSDFLPFNSTNGVPVGQDISTGRYYNVLDSQIDYWFGMRMDVDFIQGKEGMNGNEEMVFKFSGDDDVWVFIDDVLVLDLGGSHGACVGTINFAKGEIDQYFYFGEDGSQKAPNTKQHYTTTLKDCFENAGNKTPNGGWNSTETTFADYTSHKLSFFYLERGAGNANCSMDFNLPTPPQNKLTVTKQVKDSSGDNVANDSADYNFQLCDSKGEPISNPELLKYKTSSDDTERTLENGNFSLKNGQSIYFTSLDASQYQINEVLTDTQKSYTTAAAVIEGATDADIANGETATVTPVTVGAKTVKFVNTLKSLTVKLKYYGRETVNGKPADIKKEPTTYTKSYVGQEYLKYINSTDADIKKDPIGAMILDTGVAFDSASAQQDAKYKNVLDGYEMWISQAQAKAGIASFDNLHQKNEKGTYNKYSETDYHTNWYGYTQTVSAGDKTANWDDSTLTDTVSDGEKWVNYYGYTDGIKQELDEPKKDSEGKADATEVSKVSEVTIWLFNQPKQYTVEAYEAKSFGDLAKVNGKYVANKNSTTNLKAYYNQRLGLEIDENAEYSQATNHLAGYGIDSYVGTKLDTAYSVKDDSTTLKFAYWAFDENGKNIASTDILYNYRIVTNTKLYAVYTESGTVNDGKPGLTVSENERDIFFNSSGTSITRLNTEMNPYNCQNNDTNIKNVAITYIIPNSTNTEIVETKPVIQAEGVTYVLLSDVQNAIKATLNYVEENKDKYFYTVDDFDPNTEGKQTLTGIKKGNYFVFYVDGHNIPESDLTGVKDISLTNKNRIEFGSDFQTKALYGDGGNIKAKRMYAFAAMYYTNDWIVSDNFIDYDFR